MNIGIYDYDAMREDRPFSYGKVKRERRFKLEPMKVMAYYRKKKISCELCLDILNYRDYDIFYIFKDNHEEDEPLHHSVWRKANVKCYGRYFSEKYIALDEEIEKMEPDFSVYSKIIRAAFSRGKIKETTLTDLLEKSYFIRFDNGVEIDLEKLPKKRIYYICDYNISLTPYVKKAIAKIKNLSQIVATNSICYVRNFEEYLYLVTNIRVRAPDKFDFDNLTLKGKIPYSQFIKYVDQCKKNKVRMPQLCIGKEGTDIMASGLILTELVETMNRLYYCWSAETSINFLYLGSWGKRGMFARNIQKLISNKSLRKPVEDHFGKSNIKKAFGEGTRTENFLNMLKTTKEEIIKGGWTYRVI